MTKKAQKPVDYSKPLKNRQYEAFCQYSYSGANATKSAIKAKYSEKTARIKGSQLLTIIDIKKRIAFLQGKIAKSIKLSVESVIEDIQDTHRRAKSAGDEKPTELKASDMLMRHLGGYEKDNKFSVDESTLTLLGLIDGSSKGQLPTKQEEEDAGQ